MIGSRHRLNGHEFEQTPGDSGGQGSLACCSPWVAESDPTEQLSTAQGSNPCPQDSEGRLCQTS